jgi:AAA domain
LYDDQDDDLSSLDALISKAESLRSVHGRNGVFTMRSPNEILALPRDQSANFLADRVLAKGQSLLMAGIGDLGKSRLNLQQIAALTTGRLWCGLETHARGIKAVIFQAENINHRLQDDLEALKRWTGKDWKLIDQNIKIHTLETDEDFIVSLSDPAKAREMERIVRCEKAGLVSFDATYNFGIGDLNIDQDMLATCRAMTKIARSGNPDCALTMLHHALTGREGIKKAYGFERSGFARNSKVIFQLSRAVINIAPGNEDYTVLLLFCAKNNNGKKFEDTAVRLNPETMIYEPEQDFDFKGWKEQITANKTASRRKFTVDMVREANLRFTELEIKPLAKLIIDKLGCARARAYELVHECTTAKVFRHIKITDTYAKS